jgi:hypothetical protein
LLIRKFCYILFLVFLMDKLMNSEQKDLLQSKAMALLIEFKNYLAGERDGRLEQLRDKRFAEAASALLEFKDEKGVRGWLAAPCLCPDCRKLPNRMPRWDLVNSEYGFAHLTREIESLKKRNNRFQ